MRHGIGGDSGELFEIPRARGRVFFLHALFIGDGLLLHELDIERTAMAVIEIERFGRRFVANDAAEEAAQLDGVVNTEVETQARRADC